jgi:hypothetical protein
MRAPIKLNRAKWPRGISKLLPAADDPRILCDGKLDSGSFSKAVSAFKFGTTFKTTKGARFPLSISALHELKFETPPVVLDLGASDGITSLDVINTINFRRYYVTDRNTEVFSRLVNGRAYFYDSQGNPILIATDSWVAYSDTDSAIPPFGAIARRMFRQAPPMGTDSTQISLVNPLLQSKLGEGVVFKQHSILDPWPLEHADLVIAANILNRCYFTDELLATALRHIRAAANEKAYLAIIDNRDVERSTVFQLDSEGCKIVRRIAAGTEIESLALQTLSSSF